MHETGKDRMLHTTSVWIDIIVNNKQASGEGRIPPPLIQGPIRLRLELVRQATDYFN
jgi:hypothetical protein